MKPHNENQQTSDHCIEIVVVDTENALLDYEDTAEATTGGKYRCRDCGKLFDTLEEHDRHRREIHSHGGTVPLLGMPM
jgi:hypothetical protein